MKALLLAAASVAAIGPMSASERRQGRYMRDPVGHNLRTSLAALRSSRNALVATMRGMIEASEAENRDFTAEETTAYDEHQASLTALDARITRSTGLEAAESASTGSVARGTRPERPIRGPEANTSFESLGQFMSAVRFNPNDQRLNFVEGVGAADGDMDIDAEMRMDNNPSGGFMVPTEFRNTIMQVQPQDALVRPRATIIEPGNAPDASVSMPALDQNGANPGNMFGGMQFSWIGEGDQKPETDAKLREVTLTPHEIAGFVTVTDKLLRNWPAAGNFLENLMRGGVAAAEDYAFYRGNGKNKPLGALMSSATKFVPRVAAGQVQYIDLVNMVARLLMRGGQSPVWSAPQSMLVQLATMTDPEGHYIWVANARDGFAGDLLGYPLRWNNRTPGVGQRGDILLADWSQYLIKDGSGPFVAASEHVLFTSNKTIIKIFWNVDGSPWMTAPLKEENGWEVSPFVALDVPAA